MNRVNVGLVLVDTIISDAVLSVRCESRAITIWQVIDNKLPSKWWACSSSVCALNLSENGSHDRDFSGRIPVISYQPHTVITVTKAYIQKKVGTSATLAAAVAMAPESDGIADVEISDA